MATQTLERLGKSVVIETMPTGTDLIELYYDRGWSDGLPVVPPTQEKIDAVVAVLGGDREFVECKVAPRCAYPRSACDQHGDGRLPS
jgi:hypothetical protein